MPAFSHTQKTAKFIFFIYKDYPCFTLNEDSRRMLIKLIEGGANAGIFILLIGKNTEIKPKYMGEKPIEKLDLEKLNIQLIQVKDNQVTYNVYLSTDTPYGHPDTMHDNSPFHPMDRPCHLSPI